MQACGLVPESPQVEAEDAADVSSPDADAAGAAASRAELSPGLHPVPGCTGAEAAGAARCRSSLLSSCPSSCLSAGPGCTRCPCA